MSAENVLHILQTVQTLLNFVAARGVSRADAIALLQKASDENRDVTSDEVQQKLNETTLALDETEKIIQDS